MTDDGRCLTYIPNYFNYPYYLQFANQLFLKKF